MRVQSLGQEDSPGVGNGKPTPVFLPGKSHGQRSLAGHSPWCRRVRHNGQTEHTVRLGGDFPVGKWKHTSRTEASPAHMSGLTLINRGAHRTSVQSRDRMKLWKAEEPTEGTEEG